jgi:hypothetical protein
MIPLLVYVSLSLHSSHDSPSIGQSALRHDLDRPLKPLSPQALRQAFRPTAAFTLARPERVYLFTSYIQKLSQLNNHSATYSTLHILSLFAKLLPPPNRTAPHIPATDWLRISPTLDPSLRYVAILCMGIHEDWRIHL